VRLAIGGLVVLAACSARAEPAIGEATAGPTAAIAAPKKAPTAKSVLLVTLDGVRPTDVLDGVDRALAGPAGMGEGEIVPGPVLAPTLHALAAKGVGLGRKGAAFRVSGRAHLSLPGYTELMTGAPPDAVSCFDNGCRPVLSRALTDDFAAGLGLVPAEVAVISSWAPIGRVAFADRARGVLSAGQHGVANEGLLRFDDAEAKLVDAGDGVDPFPGYDDYRPDRFTEKIALRYLEVKRPRFLWVSLGDTDEHAHRGDYKAYVAALRRADAYVAELLAALPDRDGTVVVVTTDHGREAKFKNHGTEPESAPIWLVAAGGGVPARGFVELRGERALADVAPTVLRLAGIQRQGRVIEELLP